MVSIQDKLLSTMVLAIHAIADPARVRAIDVAGITFYGVLCGSANEAPVT